MRHSEVDRLERAVHEVALEVEASYSGVDRRLVDEVDLWNELVACILGSCVRYEQARDALANLRAHGLVTLPHPSADFDDLEAALADCLSRPTPSGSNPASQRYRFPRLRAGQIRRTAERLYGGGLTLKMLLDEAADPRVTRKELVDVATGIGLKQASLFLRNIGYADDLAILDIHVLDFVNMIGLASIYPPRVRNASQYEETEGMLRSYTKVWGHRLNCLDTAIWVVMRVYKSEFLP